ncbi:MAG: D-cysteine desulfhydrase family protein [Pseudomonadota bacterium]
MSNTFNYPPAFGILSRLPRTELFSGPTPLEPMPNLARACDAGNLLVKRDDCTHLAFGGNKVRQLEFYFGEALAQNADTVLITGAVQSNFVRLAAAAAAKLVMQCHVQLEERVDKTDPMYHLSGNVLLDKLFGAKMYSYDEGEDEFGADRKLREIADALEQEHGRKTYIIPLAPNHKPLGALGYMVAAQELLEQIESANIRVDEVVLGSGSGSTHGGMLFGLRALGSSITVRGICVRRDASVQKPRIEKRCQEIADLLEMKNPVTNDDVITEDDFYKPGYGKLNAATNEAILLAARKEGLVLDPTYTGKVMAGFIHRAREADKGKTLVFLHSGGTPSLFAYQDSIIAAANHADETPS